MASIRLGLVFMIAAAVSTPDEVSSQVLGKRKQLEAQTFWDNRDFDWYAEQIPFFECPDAEITTTWYYCWDLLTKHLTYGSPNDGYCFTEFIDRPFWSGAYGAISCPAGHQLYEARWLRQPRIARDYLRYWFRTPGAQPRNYSTWLADSIWAVNQIHRDDALTIDLLPDLIRNYAGWAQRHFVPAVGLLWQTGHDDGMEFNLNSRQTKDILRGAPSFRPSFSSTRSRPRNCASRCIIRQMAKPVSRRSKRGVTQPCRLNLFRHRLAIWLTTPDRRPAHLRRNSRKRPPRTRRVSTAWNTRTMASPTSCRLRTTAGPAMDVTSQVAAAVKDNKLSIKAGNATFGDTAPGIPKKLFVEYRIGDEKLKREVSENGTIEIATPAGKRSLRSRRPASHKRRRLTNCA